MAEEMQTSLGRDAPDEGGGNGLLGTLLSNPALLSGLVSGLAGSGNAGGESKPTVATAPASGETAMGSDASQAIGAVLSNPQMMAKLPEMIQMLKPLMGTISASGGAPGAVAAMAKPEKQEDKGDAVQTSASGSGAGHSKEACARERRVALLCALRPYMSPRRQEAIDYILKIDRLGKLFRNG